MADIAKKTVSIYIDQASAELALDKLQAKADGFNKKAEEARQRQQALNAEIRKAEAAAAGLDKLRANYAELEKGISKTARSLDITTASQKKLAAENKSLSATLEAATTKAAALQAEIDKAQTAGDATKRLENNYESLSRSIQETTERLRTNEAASTAAATRQQALASSLQQQKAAAAALNVEVRESAKAASSVTRLTSEYTKLDKQLATNEQALEKNLAAQKAIQSQVDAGMRPSLTQLKNLVHQLDKELQNLSEDVPGYASKFAAFRSASAQLEEMETRLRGVKKESQSLLSQFKGVAFGVAAGNLVQNAIAAIPQAISGKVQKEADLSDELSDVEKATNLSTERVKQLNKELAKIDTRTGTKQLRLIAEGLGQINQEASPKNVAAIDKIVVALGDEFGGDSKEITKQLSVLRNNLQDLRTADYAQDVEHIGNALNVLGAEGLATAPVVTDIANRIAGVSQQFKVSSGDILGFAATFQETGIEVERGSTALVKLFQNMAAEPEKFAKAAGLSVQEFTELVNTDMTAAFQKVASGIQKAGKENTAFSKILKDLDADGSGAGEVLSKLAQNSELLTAKQKRAGEALKENSSITDEFTKKNTNLAAGLEKLGKNINAYFSSSTLSNFIKGLVSGFNNLFEKTKDLNTQFHDQQTVVRNLERDVVPLITRYEQLKKKATELGGTSKLSKEEQQELNKAITTIASNIPSAITKFDQYGNAIEISTQKAKAFVEQQKLMLKALNRDAIKDFENQNKALLADVQDFQARLNRGTFQETVSGGSFNSGTTYTRRLTDKEIVALQASLKEKQALIAENKAAVASLRGDTLDQQTAPKLPATTATTTGTYTTDEEAKAADAARKKYLADLKAHNRELHEEEERREQEWEERLAAMNALTAKHRKQLEEQLKEYPEIQAKLDEFFDTEYDVQLRKVKEFYDKKRELYQNDASALKQLGKAEEAETAKAVADSVTRSVGQSTQDTLARLKNAGTANKETADRDYYAEIQRQLLEASGRERLELLTRQIVAEKDLALKNTELTEAERLLIIQQSEQQISDLKLQFETARLQMVLDFAQQAAGLLNSLAEVAANREDAELKKDKKTSDEKRKNLERLLKSKAISQAEYNRKIADLDAEDDARQEAVKKKQFERGKKLQLLQVAISTAQAIISTLAAPPGPADILSLGAIRAIQIGIAVATGAAQAAAISSKKYAKGGISQGPSHAEGGIAMVDRRTGQEVGEMEGQEGILSKKTLSNNWDLVAPLLHASMYQDGARVQLPWQSRSYQGINYSSVGNALRVVKKYETGGIAPATADGSITNTAAGQQSQDAMAGMMQQMMDAFIKKLEQPLQASVALGEINRQQGQMNRIVSDATASR